MNEPSLASLPGIAVTNNPLASEASSVHITLQRNDLEKFKCHSGEHP